MRRPGRVDSAAGPGRAYSTRSGRGGGRVLADAAAARRLAGGGGVGCADPGASGHRRAAFPGRLRRARAVRSPVADMAAAAADLPFLGNSESRDPSRVRLLTNSGALKQALLSASADPCLPFSPVLLRDSESLSRLLLLSDGPRSTAPQRVTAPRVVTAPRLLAAVRRIRAPTPPRCGAVSARRSSKQTRVCKVRVVNATQSLGSAQCSAPSRSPTCERGPKRLPTREPSMLSAQRPAAEH